MTRILVLATTTGYQTRSFGEAAERLGVELVFATDRCDRIDDPWRDRAIPIRFYDEDASVDAIVAATRSHPIDGLLVVGDRPTVIAARVAQGLGLPWHPAEGAAVARDKQRTRERLRDAGLPVPWFFPVTVGDAWSAVSHEPLTYPCVVKPVALSGSRGVIRANDPESFAAAFARLDALLASPDVRAERNAALDVALIEGFIPGREYAIEAVMDHGALYVLAIFDKPDPLDGPFFEETIYVTPSRAPRAVQQAIARAIDEAVKAIGLHHGPIHAECRVSPSTPGGPVEVFVLEVAARPIGGLCARALRVMPATRDPQTAIRDPQSAIRDPQSAIRDPQSAMPYEEALLRHAIGEDPRDWQREPDASGVMMIPIPRPGILRRVEGVERAREVPDIHDVRITAKTDHPLVPLPEGASYLGFIFARAATAEAVERALRAAHARLTVVVDAQLPVLTASQTRYNHRHG